MIEKASYDGPGRICIKLKEGEYETKPGEVWLTEEQRAKMAEELEHIKEELKKDPGDLHILTENGPVLARDWK